MKFIILLLLLGFACAVAMMLLRRLHTITSDLGDLKRDMARNESELRRRVAIAEQNKKNQEK
jgi:hypothetical protein